MDFHNNSFSCFLMFNSVDRIDEISRQTVAGMSYRIKGHYFVEGDAKQCTVTILER